MTGELAPRRAALATLPRAHDPHPPVVVDRYWNVVSGNAGAGVPTDGVPATPLGPTTNVFRLTLGPEGLATRLVHLARVRRFLLDRLARQVRPSGAPAPGLPRGGPVLPDDGAGRAVVGHRRPRVRPHPGTAAGQEPVRGAVEVQHPVLSIGTPADVTVAELAVELPYPLDERARRRCRAAGDAPARAGAGRNHEVRHCLGGPLDAHWCPSPPHLRWQGTAL
ncbi:MmyB family transcriptional regulator [Actinoalloteichus sp. AHMU CJ021]|uniref:MmyB family transcriptional regulator n=1 Tax=Actinoalloteichus sp. AHMU CJ021 TaxID=2072503 RepID=UPI003FCD6EE7